MPLSSEQSESPAPLNLSNEKKRRASKACSCCRTRKVRCDVLKTGLPCTKCRVDGFECVVQERKKRRKKNEPKDQGSPSSEQLRIDAATGASSARSIPQHTMLHQVPHYPFFRNFAPKGQQPLLPAQNRDQSALGGGNPASFLDDDVEFLRHKGAFDLPPKKVMDEFVSNYFQVFHPFFPIVDRCGFLESYFRSDHDAILNGRGPSLLLLQAILFTASATVPLSILREIGFSSRKHARSVLQRRARHLYDFDFESDDVTTIQALLLMSHYYSSMVEQKHTWFWVHQAISLAQGAGLHRDAGDAPQRKLWARIWWACLVRDRLITLGTGRPMHINSLDCNVPMLTIADLEEEGDSDDDRTVKAIFVEFVRLCQYMEGVLSLPHSVAAAANSLPEQINLCETTLQHWRDNLIPAARRREESGISFEKRDICALYRTVLHMIYNIVIVALYQSHHVLDDSRSSGAQSPPPKVQAAAEDSTRLAIELVDLDLVKFCPTICVTAILPPLIVHLLMKRASQDNSEKLLDINRFDKCMIFLHQLSEIYWHASFYHEFFQLAVSSSQSWASTQNGEKDPLIAFMNSRMPGRQQFSRALELRSRSTSRRQTPISDEKRNESEREMERKPVTKENSRNGLPSDAHTLLPLSTTQALMRHIPVSGRLGTGDAMSLDTNAQPFEDWLDDFGYFQNTFPSA